MFKKLFVAVRGKLYFVPGLFALCFTVLAVVFIYLEVSMHDVLARSLPVFLFTSRGDGVSILSMAAGSLVAMMTFTFSIMMVVLTLYGSQLSPRTLQDFLEKRITLRILGFFIGALVFTAIS